MPGIYTAKNKAAMEAPPLANEYTIKILLGGITNPVVAEVIFIATPKPLEYPSFSISGPKILPMAEADAMAEPATEPINMADITLISAKPPGKKPTNALANATSLWATPPLFINSPDNIKNGIANKAKLSIPVAMRWEIVVNAGKKGTLTKRVNSDDIIILQATGVPIDSSNKKLNNSMTIEKTSIMICLMLDHRTCKKQYMPRLVVHTYKQGIVEFVMRQIFDLAHNLNIQVLSRQ